VTDAGRQGAAGTDPGDVSLRDLGRESWTYVARRAARGLLDDDGPDLAAGLTYYTVLSLFPAAIALLSLVGLVGDPTTTVRTLTGILEQLGADQAVRTLEPTLTTLAQARQAAGLALVLGLATAVWSASGYVGAFGRALNRVYGVPEGRPVWKLRPYQMALTLVVLVLGAFVAIALVVSGSIAQAIGDSLGLGSTAVLVWRVAKWPLVLLAVVFVVGLLYYATPNVRHSRFRWLSVGASVAIVTWVVASLLFAVYVANFSSYNRVYGSLAGVVVFLLWVWITNLALLLGGEIDAEIERGRELRGGLRAEERLQLELRDSRGVEKAEQRHEEDVRRARELRDHHAGR
jgi:membrane protein